MTRVRGFVETEVNRVLNRLVKVHRPRELVLESLNFRSPELSKRMNRIVQNCGRGVIQRKLKALEEELGIESHEVHAAYTSQGCSCCQYVDKRNRRTQERFECPVVRPQSARRRQRRPKRQETTFVPPLARAS